MWELHVVAGRQLTRARRRDHRRVDEKLGKIPMYDDVTRQTSGGAVGQARDAGLRSERRSFLHFILLLL